MVDDGGDDQALERLHDHHDEHLAPVDRLTVGLLPGVVVQQAEHRGVVDLAPDERDDVDGEDVGEH